ncbi:MAG: hypothetical protein RMA76_30130 [Deltaproteobacteria bacterium]|jgi:hypothetical protein
MRILLVVFVLLAMTSQDLRAAPGKPGRARHHRASRSKSLRLVPTTQAREVTVVKLVDGQVHFTIVDEAQLPPGTVPAVSRALLTPATEVALLRKVGQRVKLHVSRDAKGVPYVVRVTRP